MEQRRVSRTELIAGLQERIKIIQSDIARLESQISVASDEKRIHEEDLPFHLCLMEELGGFESESNKLLEVIQNPETAQERISGPNKPAKISHQEAKDRARAWHIDRQREKIRKSK
jgi:hypothetical protein